MRVVLEHSQGPWAGMRQILGTVDQVCSAMQVPEMPAYILDINFGDRTSGAALVSRKKTYLVYKEQVPPAFTQKETDPCEPNC